MIARCLAEFEKECTETQMMSTTSAEAAGGGFAQSGIKMGGTFTRIDQALNPLRKAVQELQAQNFET